MNKTQDALFKKWFDKCYWTDRSFRREISIWPRRAWEACLEANNIEGQPEIPEGYFKIGEEVEIRVENPHGDTCWVSRVVGAVPYVDPFLPMCTLKPEGVRRTPDWKPKEGEAVLFSDGISAAVGVFSNGQVYYESSSVSAEHVKPFDASKIGKPWGEI